MSSSDSEPRSHPAAAPAVAHGGQAAAAGGGDWSPTQLVWLFAITVLAGALRMWQIELWSVSSAEALTWRDATRAVPEGFGLVDRTLRALFEHGWLPAHGEGWLRLPFVFFGVVVVPLLALVGAPLVGRRAALLAAALLAVHPWHVEASQTATGHAPAFTFGLLACGLASAGVRRRARWPWLLAALMLLGAGLSHPGAWLLVHTVIAARLFGPRRDGSPGALARPLLTAAIVLIATVGLALLLRPAGATALGPGAFLLLPGFAVTVSLPVLVAAVVPLLRDGWRHGPTRQLCLVLSVPPLVAVACGLGAVPVAVADLMIVLPAALLLAGAGAVFAFDRMRQGLAGERSLGVRCASAMVAVALLLDLGVATFLYAAARRGSRPDWRTARDVVLRTSERGDLFVLAGQGFQSLLYYLRPDHWRAAELDPHPRRFVVSVPAGAADPVELAAAAAARGADSFCVFVDGELTALRRNPVARERLASGFRLIEVLPGAGAAADQTVYVFRGVAPE